MESTFSLIGLSSREPSPSAIISPWNGKRNLSQGWIWSCHSFFTVPFWVPIALSLKEKLPRMLGSTWPASAFILNSLPVSHPLWSSHTMFVWSCEHPMHSLTSRQWNLLFFLPRILLFWTHTLQWLPLIRFQIADETTSLILEAFPDTSAPTLLPV